MSPRSQTLFTLPPVPPPLCHGAFSVDPRTESDPELSACEGPLLPPMTTCVTYLIGGAEEEKGRGVETFSFSAWLKEYFKSTDAASFIKK